MAEKKGQKRLQTPALLLLSGGIDSTACAFFLRQRGFDVRCLFIDYGQKAALLEMQAARRLARHLKLPFRTESLQFRRRFGVGEHVGRNAFFITAALMTGWLERGVISIGVHAGTRYYDCSSTFVERMDVLLQEYTNGRVQLLAPFVDWMKEDILEFCDVEKISLKKTYSCEAGVSPPCGKCETCRDLARFNR